MADSLDVERKKVADMLADGLATEWETRAYSQSEIQNVLRDLNALAPDDLAGKLRVAGFTLTPYVGPEDPEIEQSCLTCMYFEPHRRYCNLPELKVAAEPEWSCVLWRI